MKKTKDGKGEKGRNKWDKSEREKGIKGQRTKRDK
jgi:hypothetical protein